MVTSEQAISHDDMKRYLAEGRSPASCVRGISASMHVSRRLRAVAWITLLRRTASMVRRGIAVTSDAAQRTAEACVRNHRRHSYLYALQSLNDHTLKDLGLHRSEIYSAVHELVDDVPPSRLRSPAWMARTGAAVDSAEATANDERFADQVA